MTSQQIMPVRLPPITDNASRVLLEGIVDYAGLFPPASVSLPHAVRDYAHYRASGTGWMLGRFICPASSLNEFSKVGETFLPRDAGAIPWRLSVIGSGNPSSDADIIADFNQRHRVCFEECGAIVDAYETRVTGSQDIARISDALPSDVSLYFELPANHDPSTLIEAVAAAGHRAKLRTGGVTSDAFPSSTSVARFLACCIQLNVPCKATAGLHHALRGDYRLTYDEQSDSSRMFGFVNVFLAAALLASGAREIDAIAMLDESDWSRFTVNDLQIGWLGPEGAHVLDRVLIAQVRQQVLTSFGSCSFTEPVNECRDLGLL